MKKLAILIISAGLLAGCMAQAQGQKGHAIDFNLGSFIAEDDPRWDCRKHGDKQCGKPFCEAITKAGKRCSRRGPEAGLLCKQHSKMVKAGKKVETVK